MYLIVQHYRPRGRRKSSILCNTEVIIFKPVFSCNGIKTGVMTLAMMMI